jgi:hypothetical protein
VRERGVNNVPKIIILSSWKIGKIFKEAGLVGKIRNIVFWLYFVAEMKIHQLGGRKKEDTRKVWRPDIKVVGLGFFHFLLIKTSTSLVYKNKLIFFQYFHCFSLYLHLYSI